MNRIEKFTIYNGDLKVEVEITDEKKDLIINRILDFCKEHDCVCGESGMQDDDFQIYAPNLIAGILDDILQPKTELDYTKEWFNYEGNTTHPL